MCESGSFSNEREEESSAFLIPFLRETSVRIFLVASHFPRIGKKKSRYVNSAGKFQQIKNFFLLAERIFASPQGRLDFNCVKIENYRRMVIFLLEIEQSSSLILEA